MDSLKRSMRSWPPLDPMLRRFIPFFSATQLPLVVAITTIARENGEMLASTSAALVGAAMLSTLIFPLVGLRLRAGRAAGDLDERVEAELEAEGFGPAPATA